MLTVLGAVGLLLVIAAGTLFSRAFVRPVNRLVDAASRLGEGRFEEPVAAPSSSADEADHGDEIAFFAGSQTNVQDDITGSEDLYGVGQLNADVTAGATSIAVRWGYIPEDQPIESWHADFVINHPDDILDHLKR